MARRAKPQKRKVEGPLARKSPRNDGARARDLDKRLAEAQEQQAATAEILDAISRSPTDLQPILEAVAQNASRLCGAANVSLYRVEGDQMRKVAEQGRPLTALRVGETRPITRTTVSGRAVVDRTTIHLPDHQSTEAAQEYPDARRDTGIRTTIGIPLLREGVAIGVFTAYRTEARPFAEREIALLQTFANQAVIAIENVRLFNETKEALERQTATGEILRVISRSPTDVQPVFDAIAESAARLCGAVDAIIQRVDGDTMQRVAHFGAITSMSDARRVTPDTPSGRAILERQTIHIDDILESFARGEYLETQALQRGSGFRTVLVVPLIRDDIVIGIITIRRLEVLPFTDQQIALLKTFADQAVIAIENVRLFRELEARNSDLTEALDQQTATSAILRVISSSPTDEKPVFDAIARSSVQLCGAAFAVVASFDGETLHFVAGEHVGIDGRRTLAAVYPMRPNRGQLAGRAILDRTIIHVADVTLDPEYVGASLGNRATLSVPMIRTGAPIGTITIGRFEPVPFTEQQVALLKTFADQAVIAIENVRLFNETKEALERQTATGEILRVIASSPTDIQPVFAAVATSAARLCDAFDATIFQIDGDQLRVAVHNGPIASHPVGHGPSLTRGTPSGRAVCDRRVIHVADTQIETDEYPEGSEHARRLGFRTVLAVPLMREDRAIGVINLRRTEARLFTERQVALLETFASQAVIAIENVRLFKELEARTQDLTRSVGELRALGEVGQAISSTLDLETVLGTIVARATQLSGTDAGVIYEYDGQREIFLPRATARLEAEIVETMLATPVRKGEGATGRLADGREPVQVPDILAAPAESRVRDALVRAGYRALLAVPLVREGHLIGGLTVIGRATGTFASEVIELLQTFATQSSLAIQNARLFREIEEKSRQLEIASQHKSEFLANMSHELRTPLNAIIGFSEVLSERMFGELNEKQEEYLKDIYASGTHLLSLINDILDLSKIEAGRMELELSEFHLPTAIENALMLVRERAGRKSIALHANTDKQLGQAQADERKVRQVLLNLLSNAIKFTPEGGRIEVAAVAKDGLVEVSVSDTGVGIAPEDREAVFEEFRQVGTSDKKVEGTGLGLTLCRKFVELHGGRIWVRSELGAGSTFTFTIPTGK